MVNCHWIILFRGILNCQAGDRQSHLCILWVPGHVPPTKNGDLNNNDEIVPILKIWIKK